MPVKRKKKIRLPAVSRTSVDETAVDETSYSPLKHPAAPIPAHKNLEPGVDVAATFREILESEPMLATAIAAIRTLIKVLEKCPAITLQVRLDQGSLKKVVN